MKNMTLDNIAAAVNGQLCGEYDKSFEVKGVVLDSRKVEEGFLFVATKGERVDGHSFISSVFEKGAAAVICEVAPVEEKGPFILVKDSFQALKDVATFYRQQLDIKVVGITGSVGKTSTKECVASVLSQKYKVWKTSGNFNNEIGLPLTVLQIRQEHEIAVLEMGISDFGEMHRLSSIARPDICVITNIGQCHLENLKTRDGILKAKSEIFDFMSKDGAIIVNGDDDKLSTLQKVGDVTPLFFGENPSMTFYADEIVNKGLAGSKMRLHRKLNGEEAFEASIPLPGEHMIYNALAASAVGTVLSLTIEEIQKGLVSVEAVGGRSHIISTDDYTVIDDCYNANPVSMKAAIDLLSMANTRKVAILGDMFELGENEKLLHEEVGSYASLKGIDVVLCTGELCHAMYQGVTKDFNGIAVHFDTLEELLKNYKEYLEKEDTILIKASHGMHFENVVSDLSK